MIHKQLPMFFLAFILCGINCVINTMDKGDDASFRHFSDFAQEHKRAEVSNFFENSTSLLGRHCGEHSTDSCYNFVIACRSGANRGILYPFAYSIADQVGMLEDRKKAEVKEFVKAYSPPGSTT